MELTIGQKLEAYRRMLRIRKFEEEGSRQFKAGKIPGVFHTSIGHEAAIVGACMALRDEDAMTGTHRSHGHPIGKGGDLRGLMAELMGRETGICKGRGGSMHLADRSVGIISESGIVGGGIPLATGCGFSAKVRGVDQVTLCFFGDGAVNQGTFHESLNMASLWKLPVIYLCENNGYAVTASVPQTHGQTDIALRAIGFGMPSLNVEGQDVEAVYLATAEAVERAKKGLGPSLIVANTYRFDEHNAGLAVPGNPYRSNAEVEFHRLNRDPLALYQKKLLAGGISEDKLAEIEAGVVKAVEDAVNYGLASPYPKPEDLAEYMFNSALLGHNSRAAGLSGN